MKDAEAELAVTSAYRSGGPKAVVLLVPQVAQKIIGVKPGDRFRVLVDKGGRLVYEPMGQLQKRWTKERRRG